MMIHPSAIIHPKAQLDEGVQVGAYSIIDEQVTIGKDTVIGDHVKISGKTTIGQRNKIYSFAALGGDPQDKKYRGENTALEIGHDNVIREFCTFNIGTVDDGGVTRLGNHNWIMAYVHLAHDCQVGNHTTFANNASLAGHVHVGDWAILAGFSGVHQFCRVGAHSFIGISAVVTQDVPPFVTVAGNPTSPHGINSEGLKRRGYSSEEIMAIKRAYRKLYRSSLSLDEAKNEIQEIVSDYPKVQLFLDFLLQPSPRGIMR
jgi:UDP-N-acetylglucosamine acyltransferase